LQGIRYHNNQNTDLNNNLANESSHKIDSSEELNIKMEMNDKNIINNPDANRKEILQHNFKNNPEIDNYNIQNNYFNDVNNSPHMDADEDHKEISRQSNKDNKYSNVGKKLSDSRSYKSHYSNISNKNVNNNDSNNYSQEIIKNFSKNRYRFNNKYTNEDPVNYNCSEHYMENVNFSDQNLISYNDDFKNYRRYNVSFFTIIVNK